MNPDTNTLQFRDAFNQLHQAGELWEKEVTQPFSEESVLEAANRAYALISPFRETTNETSENSDLEAAVTALVTNLKALIQVKEQLVKGIDMSAADLVISVSLNDTEAEVDRLLNS